MEIWLAIVAFCAAEGCAFFVAKTTFENKHACEAQAAQMTIDLENHLQGEVVTIPGCVRVPMKVT
jgi:hypothetical protein